jgi:sphinganine-1-phosphate aldolase
MPEHTLPQQGIDRAKLVSSMRSMRSEDGDWQHGRMFGLVYYIDQEHAELIREAYSTFIFENGLSPLAFPSLRRFETEVVAMTAGLLGGGDEAVGNMTSGGSESIFLAVKAARDRARAERPSVTAPEMVLPITAHPAFDKAAHCLGIKPVRTRIDSRFRADVEAARAAVNHNTVLIVGSAPTYPHGIIDPIQSLAAIAQERSISFHSDACLGGFVLPFAKRLGYDIPPFDFSVPGVTSMSADVHKFGFAPKGASVVLYRNNDYRKHQYYVQVDWPGGIYATPNMSGARPGGAIAAAWAVMHYFGLDGYMKLTRTMMETTRRLIDGINAIDGLAVLGKPDMNVFAFGSDTLNIYALGEAMGKRRWHIEPQHMPPCLHMTISPFHANVTDEFLKDLAAAAEEVRGLSDADLSGTAALYGTMATLPDRGAAKEFAMEFLGQIFRAG